MMPALDSALLAAAIIVFLGALLQGLAAFGFALFAVPLLLWAGLPLPVVLALTAVCTVVQAGAGAHHLRNAVPWRTVGLSIPFRALGLVTGIFVLRSLIETPVITIRFWVGAVMLLLVLAMALWRPRPCARLSPGWNIGAFTISGFTGGLVSMGGPPLVLWVLAHDWEPRKTRGFLFAAFLCIAPLQILLLYLNFGAPVLRGLLLGLLLSPLVFGGGRLGLLFGNRCSKAWLQRIAIALLIVIALSAMAPQVRRWAAGGAEVGSQKSEVRSPRAPRDAAETGT